jgi:hypothetical protein
VQKQPIQFELFVDEIEPGLPWPSDPDYQYAVLVLQSKVIIFTTKLLHLVDIIGWTWDSETGLVERLGITLDMAKKLSAKHPNWKTKLFYRNK